ncbi:lysophospholipid acyltransferase family protein [Sphingosinicella sp.]|uniref:lysophospholipid acyltransferase family protein n=1 Tax=Sphingosinicella sp. TaxID=1917971 RepID=UPI004037D4F9
MIRMIARLGAIGLGLLLFVPLHYSWKLAGRRSPWPQAFLGFAARRCGLRVTVGGTPVAGSVLFAANHESWLDILAIGGVTGASFVAKDEVRRLPMVGWLAGLNATLYVVRAARHQVQAQADQIRDKLAEGGKVALFPEGTVDATRDVLPFRASLFASLYPPIPAVVVQPVALDYGAATATIAWLDDESMAGNVRRILSRLGTIPVTLAFLAPIDPAAAEDRKALAAMAREEIVAALASAAPAHPL